MIKKSVLQFLAISSLCSFSHFHLQAQATTTITNENALFAFLEEINQSTSVMAFTAFLQTGHTNKLELNTPLNFRLNPQSKDTSLTFAPLETRSLASNNADSLAYIVASQKNAGRLVLENGIITLEEGVIAINIGIISKKPRNTPQFMSDRVINIRGDLIHDQNSLGSAVNIEDSTVNVGGLVLNSIGPGKKLAHEYKRSTVSYGSALFAGGPHSIGYENSTVDLTGSSISPGSRVIHTMNGGKITIAAVENVVAMGGNISMTSLATASTSGYLTKTPLILSAATAVFPGDIDFSEVAFDPKAAAIEITAPDNRLNQSFAQKQLGAQRATTDIAESTIKYDPSKTVSLGKVHAFPSMDTAAKLTLSEETLFTSSDSSPVLSGPLPTGVSIDNLRIFTPDNTNPNNRARFIISGNGSSQEAFRVNTKPGSYQGQLQTKDNVSFGWADLEFDEGSTWTSLGSFTTDEQTRIVANKNVTIQATTARLDGGLWADGTTVNAAETVIGGIDSRLSNSDILGTLIVDKGTTDMYNTQVAGAMIVSPNATFATRGSTSSPAQKTGLSAAAADFAVMVDTLTLAPLSTIAISLNANQQVVPILVTGETYISDPVTVKAWPQAGIFSRRKLESQFLYTSSIAGYDFVDGGSRSPLIKAAIFKNNEGNWLMWYSRNSFLQIAGLSAPRSVLSAFDCYMDMAISSEAMYPELALMSTYSLKSLQQVVNSVQPSQIKAIAISQENNAVKVRDTLLTRFERELDAIHCYHDSDSPCSVKARDFHVWATGFGDNLHQGKIKNYGYGYQSNTGGVSLGVDYHFADVMYVGALGAYSNSDIHWTKDLGSTDISSGYAGIYASAISKMYWATIAAIGGWSDYSGHRNAILPFSQYTMSNKHNGSQILSHADTGINLGIKGFTIRPFDSFDYISQTENGYKEKGNGEFKLSIKSQNSIMIRNELGINFAGCFCMANGEWTISPKISWVREVRVKGQKIHASFADSDCSSFSFNGYFPSRSLVSPGVTLQGNFMKDLLTVALYYNGEYQGNYSDHSYGGQLRFGF